MIAYLILFLLIAATIAVMAFFLKRAMFYWEQNSTEEEDRFSFLFKAFGLLMSVVLWLYQIHIDLVARFIFELFYEEIRL